MTDLNKARDVSKLLREYRNYKAVHTMAADTIDALVAEVERLTKVDVGPVAWMRPSSEGYDSNFRDHSTVKICTGNPWTGWIPLVPASALAALRKENERLTACLAKANSNHEEFERKWYLACDERDTLRIQLAEAQKDRDEYRKLLRESIAEQQEMLAEWTAPSAVATLRTQLAESQKENLRLAGEVANRNIRALEGDNAVAALNKVHDYYEKQEAKRKGLEADAARYSWLAEYLISDSTKHDDSIVAAKSKTEIDAVVDASLKGDV